MNPVAFLVFLSFLLAVLSFGGAAFGESFRRLNLVATGLFFFALPFLYQAALAL